VFSVFPRCSIAINERTISSKNTYMYIQMQNHSIYLLTFVSLDINIAFTCIHFVLFSNFFSTYRWHKMNGAQCGTNSLRTQVHLKNGKHTTWISCLIWSTLQVIIIYCSCSHMSSQILNLLDLLDYLLWLICLD